MNSSEVSPLNFSKLKSQLNLNCLKFLPRSSLNVVTLLNLVMLIVFAVIFNNTNMLSLKQITKSCSQKTSTIFAILSVITLLQHTTLVSTNKIKERE